MVDARIFKVDQPQLPSVGRVCHDVVHCVCACVSVFVSFYVRLCACVPSVPRRCLLCSCVCMCLCAHVCVCVCVLACYTHTHTCVRACETLGRTDAPTPRRARAAGPPRLGQLLAAEQSQGRAGKVKRSNERVCRAHTSHYTHTTDTRTHVACVCGHHAKKMEDGRRRQRRRTIP